MLSPFAASVATRPLLKRRRGLPHCYLLTRRRVYHELSYATHGDPDKVLKYVSASPEPNPATAMSSSLSSTTMLRVKMLAAPWNPADAMGVQGRYPSPYGDNEAWSRNDARLSPSATSLLPPNAQANGTASNTVAGSEGIGQVEDIVYGSSTSSRSSLEKDDPKASFQVGDYVVPGQAGLGTLRSTLWVPSSAVIRIERGAGLLKAVIGGFSPIAVAPLFQTGGTALRMLRLRRNSGEGNRNGQDHDPTNGLAKGDVVVQNAGNSAVGVMVSQLAASMGLQCVSLVRKGNNTARARSWDDLVQYLTVHGKNALVLPDNEEGMSRLDVEAVQALLRDLSPRPPRLALNAVGGASATTLLNLLGPSATMITYGGMSRQAVSVPTAHLIFRNVHVMGYWHSRWMASESTAAERHCLMNELVEHVLNGAVECPPVQGFALSNYQQALAFEAAQSGEAIRRKVVFDCRE